MTHAIARCALALGAFLAAARDAARKIKVEYEVLPHLVREEDLTKAGNRVKPVDRVGREDRAVLERDRELDAGARGTRVS